MKKSLYIALIACSSLLVISTACSKKPGTTNHIQSAQAAEKVSTESIQQTASAITVKVSVGKSIGSGVLVAKSGNIYTVVTNAHVISRGDCYQIETVDGKIYQATFWSMYAAFKSALSCFCLTLVSKLLIVLLRLLP